MCRLLCTAPSHYPLLLVWEEARFLKIDDPGCIIWTLPTMHTKISQADERSEGRLTVVAILGTIIGVWIYILGIRRRGSSRQGNLDCPDVREVTRGRAERASAAEIGGEHITEMQTDNITGNRLRPTAQLVIQIASSAEYLSRCIQHIGNVF